MYLKAISNSILYKLKMPRAAQKGCSFHGEKMEHKVFTQPKKRQSFNIMRENAIIEDLTPKLPEGESFVYITSGGFSSIAFIVWIAGQTRIKSLFASTLRIGVR